MTRFVATFLAVLLVSGTAFAQETAMTGKQILATLSGATVEGDGWSQSFLAGGSTIHTARGTPSSGRWDVQGDRYCSVWPPSDVWACYAMTMSADDATVTWIAASGEKTLARLIKKGQ